MNRKYRHYAVLDDRETEVEVEITVYSWGRIAQTYGPAEGCYPAEDPEADVTAAWLVEDAAPRPDVLPSLSDAELSRFVSEFLQDPPEGDDD